MANWMDVRLWNSGGQDLSTLPAFKKVWSLPGRGNGGTSRWGQSAIGFERDRNHFVFVAITVTTAAACHTGGTVRISSLHATVSGPTLSGSSPTVRSSHCGRSIKAALSTVMLLIRYGPWGSVPCRPLLAIPICFLTRIPGGQR